ncbi:uncharacterized protein LOC108116755 [Drosophila eugracilis]|uniref:uncharacterized protein LOC108116755 n=1 Tax=Drosophila eugracilis TaxID=29029 RepID=UPI001BD9BEB4|nr:uncharacterized protein LOC108116755 [Drosophila eugracilis]
MASDFCTNSIHILKMSISVLLTVVCLITMPTPMAKILMLETQCLNFNRSYLYNVTLIAKNSRINLDLYLLRGLVQGVTMDIQFLLSLQNSNKFQRIFQYSLDMCNLLARRRYNIFKGWFATFFEAGNFKKYCPVEPNYYYLKDYNYNTLFLPKFLVQGKYRVKFNMNQLRNNDRIKDFIVACDFVVEIK